MSKKRTLEELRQTKDSVYTPPTSHTDYEFVTHRFTESKLIEYIKECISKTVDRDCVFKIDEGIIEDFVKSNKV